MKADAKPDRTPARPQTAYVTTAEDGGHPGLLWVDRHGHILEGCEHTEPLFGYRAEQLSGLPITALLPDLGNLELLKGGAINPDLAFRCRCGAPFRAAHLDGSERHCSLFISQVHLPEGHAVRLIVRRLPD